ncbi:MAG: family 43 glycosylhydrolase [Acidobacteriaceae bacterium]|nr:family 43 glycosylhydrolase [Acidobacteriaceae bacterium]
MAVIEPCWWKWRKLQDGVHFGLPSVRPLPAECHAGLQHPPQSHRCTRDRQFHAFSLTGTKFAGHSNTASHVFRTGHNGFFKSLDGKEDWIIYHANSAPGQGCGATRSPRIQRFTWNPDGTPNFGIPQAESIP